MPPVDGFVAVTDPGWYEHLSRTPGPKDANFWRPSARAFRLDVGTPFLFKLKAPHNAIAGYGYFAGFTILPDWLAWDTFGDRSHARALLDGHPRRAATEHRQRRAALGSPQKWGGRWGGHPGEWGGSAKSRR